MYNSGWNKLIKSNDCYKYAPTNNVKKKYCLIQMSFNHDEEYLIVGDTKGYLHYIELPGDVPCCKILGKIGRPTFLAFNPIYTEEILIGLDTGDIKIWKLCTDVNEFSLLSGHKLAPTHISFYKHHCLTSSRNEVIIWDLNSYNKVHQLNVRVKNAVRKAAFSNVGHIVVLYHNDTIQAWTLRQLHKDTKIDTKIFGIRYIKDFIFTKDGRAMIMGGTRNISILNTYDWSLLRKLCLPNNFVEAKQLSVVPCPLDGGANKILAFLSSKNMLQFCDINALTFLKIPISISRIKKFVISSTGRYIAYIDQEGCLNIMHTDKIISKKCLQPNGLLKPYRVHAHKISDHLEYVRQSMKQELNTKRLMPILKEFGEYPEKYRILIWSTILKLPANKNAYIALTSKVTREKFALNTLRSLPLADKSKASLLAMTIDCLLQWCPFLIQCPFLPNLIFPFLMTFQKDPLLAFELILSILLNYCQKWFEYHPLPPLNILGIIENILLEADPILLNIFCEHGITSREYAWPLLQTAMSEVLSGDEWLILWDHLISFQKPSLLLMCVVAYNIFLKENIISLLKLSEDIKAFYNTQNHIRAKDLLKIARKLDQKISKQIHPNYYLRDKLLQLNHSGPYPSFILEEYPKFLTENLLDLEKLKMQEQNLEEYNCRVADFEKRRLHAETEAFARQIHEARINEVQKCFQEHINNLNWKWQTLLPYAEKEKFCFHLYTNSDKKSERKQECNNCKIGEEIISNEDANSRNYKKLQQDVTKLECEVQNFLDSLR
ncbi:WD repeat-containing protein 67 [Trachymyrmex septentrionalis]|uniref:WD repeat-containing protein 67 n=1 Tax=Trachymyrmex septentrionalis TaxID=34720 RepID=A0A195FK46_9HYME|nr:PREDICTED: TBC1 domain family member 31 [Trachymyrmex septentrionalis]KYN40726.1 WD repeat-containing protein 67 [Trachymyrmex septentrionalis]